MYQVIRSDSDIDRGGNTGQTVEKVLRDLETKVNAAGGAGWECLGGLQYITRPCPHGTYHVAMQGMTISEEVLANKQKALATDILAAQEAVKSISDPYPPETNDSSASASPASTTEETTGNRDGSPASTTQEAPQVGPNSASARWNDRRPDHTEKSRKVAAAARSALEKP